MSVESVVLWRSGVPCRRSVPRPAIHNAMLNKRVGYMDDQHREYVRSPAYPALFSRASCPKVEYDHQDALCAPLIQDPHGQRRYIQYNESLEEIATQMTNPDAVKLASPAELQALLLFRPRLSRVFLAPLHCPEWARVSLRLARKIYVRPLYKRDVQTRDP